MDVFAHLFLQGRNRTDKLDPYTRMNLSEEYAGVRCSVLFILLCRFEIFKK